jgi:hypothetical protein
MKVNQKMGRFERGPGEGRIEFGGGKRGVEKKKGTNKDDSFQDALSSENRLEAMRTSHHIKSYQTDFLSQGNSIDQCRSISIYIPVI